MMLSFGIQSVYILYCKNGSNSKIVITPLTITIIGITIEIIGIVTAMIRIRIIIATTNDHVLFACDSPKARILSHSYVLQAGLGRLSQTSVVPSFAIESQVGSHGSQKIDYGH